MLLSFVFLLAHALLAAGTGDLVPPPSDLQRTAGTLQPVGASEPPTTEVRPGEPAPNFSYQSSEGRWRRLRDLTDKGAVLLVFAPREHTLIRLEREREDLLKLGVITMAVLDVKSSAARSLVQRLDLDYMVLADPRCVLASQFNVVDPITQSAVPSWFVIDRRNKVRGLERGSLPVAGYPALAAQALALPLPGGLLPSAK
jgi:peroxiredoxin